jgi:hypothetical protein
LCGNEMNPRKGIATRGRDEIRDLVFRVEMR